MKILAIGNSFSEDGTRYLYQIAKAAQVDMKVVNLIIGGCPLRLHFANSIENYRNYGMQLNGMDSGFKVSIREALRIPMSRAIRKFSLEWGTMCLAYFHRKVIPGM